MLLPRKETPDLTLPLLGGGQFKLSEEKNALGTILCFYRGRHCPICISYLKELTRMLPEFQELGVDAVAISSDTAERAESMLEAVGGEGLRYAYDLPLATAREDWDLFISEGRGKTSIGIEEPPMFSEPGLFLINTGRTLYYKSIQTMPFTRPHFSELLGAVKAAINKNYPARGEYTGPL